ncbi:MAG TPA: hypothetical protein VK821_11185 [Dehalococcoidia bacterium]|nr:hypothetical protein [Dehalococcoidia bacterium]
MTTKAERREAKRRAARQRIPRHGGALATVYANAALKRARRQKRKKR